MSKKKTEDPASQEGLGQNPMSGSEFLANQSEFERFKEQILDEVKSVVKAQHETTFQDSNSSVYNTKNDALVEDLLQNMFNHERAKLFFKKVDISTTTSFLRELLRNPNFGSLTMEDQVALLNRVIEKRDAIDLAKTLQDRKYIAAEDLLKDMRHAADLEKLNGTKWSPDSDLFDRFMSIVPTNWKDRLERDLVVMNRVRRGEDALGRKIVDSELSTSSGREHYSRLLLKVALATARTPMNFPVPYSWNEPYPLTPEAHRDDMGFLKDFNRAKYKAYLHFIRDQVALLPLQQGEFRDLLKIDEIKSLLGPETINELGLESAFKNLDNDVDHYSDLIIRGFNRALINSVITPSIRTIVSGSQLGMTKLSEIDPSTAALVYTQLLFAVKRKTPAAFITRKITEYANNANKWLNDAKLFVEVSQNGVPQSAPFVLSAISAATNDDNLNLLAGIDNWDDVSPDAVTFHVAGINIERKVQLRNVFGDPLILKDSINNDLTSLEVTRADLYKLVCFYAYLNVIDFRRDLSEESLSKYLTFSGNISDILFEASSIRSLPIWSYIEQLSKITLLQDLSEGRIAHDSLAAYVGVNSANLQPMEDYVTHIMAASYDAVKKTVYNVLSALKSSTSYYDDPIWKDMIDWDSSLSINDDYIGCNTFSANILSRFESASAITVLENQQQVGNMYYVDTRVLSGTIPVRKEFKSLIDTLRNLDALGIKVTQTVYLSAFYASYSNTFDATRAMQVIDDRCLRKHLLGEFSLISTDDREFRYGGEYYTRPLSNLSFVSQSSEAEKLGQLVVRKTSNGSILLSNDAKTADPGTAYAIIGKVKPIIVTEFNGRNHEDDYGVPIEFLASNFEFKNYSAEDMDSLFSLNWRDPARRSVLMGIDPEIFLTIKKIDKTSFNYQARFEIPTSVESLKSYIMHTEYDVSEKGIASAAADNNVASNTVKQDNLQEKQSADKKKEDGEEKQTSDANSQKIAKDVSENSKTKASQSNVWAELLGGKESK